MYEEYIKQLHTEAKLRNGNQGDSGFELESSREQTDYGISITGCMAGDCLRYEIMYNPNTFAESEIKLILNKLVKICKEFVRDMEQKVFEVEDITEEERQCILETFNNTDRERLLILSILLL